jgi:hypothetical protein
MNENSSDEIRKQQKELDDLLDRNADKTILITPFPMDEAPRNEHAEKKLQWMVDRCSSTDKNGNPLITFAEPHLRETFGYVIEYFDRDFALGKLIHDQLTEPPKTGKHSKSPCEIARESLCMKKPQDNIYLNSDNWKPDSKDEKIHFKIFDTGVREINLRDISGSSETNGNEQTSIAKKVILFGANYGQDDIYTTPLGPKYGLNIHAAIAGSEANPIWANHLIDLLLDILIGFIFGLWVHKAWGKYFEFATSPESEPDSAQSGSRQLQAYRWLVALILGYFLILVAFIVFAFGCLSFGAWLSPIPISVGMLIHGFAEGSVSVAKHRLRHLQASHSSQASIDPTVNKASGVVMTFPCAMWIGIVGIVFIENFLHLLHSLRDHFF